MGKKVIDLSDSAFREEWKRRGLVNGSQYQTKKNYIKKQLEIFKANPTWESFDEIMNTRTFAVNDEYGLILSKKDLEPLYIAAINNIDQISKINPPGIKRATEYFNRAQFALDQYIDYKGLALLKAAISHEDILFAHRAKLHMTKWIGRRSPEQFQGASDCLIIVVDKRFEKEILKIHGPI